ncbi:MAG: hypothetical protein OXC57_05340 [Rhodobacteraceae bacterium]|nr:hypothetical protein [Paracoccaceae bacterium]
MECRYCKSPWNKTPEALNMMSFRSSVKWQSNKNTHCDLAMNRGSETIIRTWLATASQMAVKWNAVIASPHGTRPLKP